MINDSIQTLCQFQFFEIDIKPRLGANFREIQMMMLDRHKLLRKLLLSNSCESSHKKSRILTISIEMAVIPEGLFIGHGKGP